MIKILDDHRIIVKIFIDFDQNSVRQPYYLTIQEELDDHWVLLEFLLDFIRIFQELDDHRVIVKFALDFIRILQELDDHRIIVKIFIDFDQNSVRQPYYYWRGNNKATN